METAALGVQLVSVSNTHKVVGIGIIVVTALILIFSNKRINNSGYSDTENTVQKVSIAGFGLIMVIIVPGILYTNLDTGSANDANVESISEHYDVSFFVNKSEDYRSNVLPNSSDSTKMDKEVNIIPNEEADPEGINGVLRIRGDHAVLLVPENDNRNDPEYVEYGE